MTTVASSLLPNDKVTIESFVIQNSRRSNLRGYFTQGKINANRENDKSSYRKIAPLKKELQFVTDLSFTVLNNNIQFEIIQGKKILICANG
jgi:hypothetical protein